MFLFDFLRLQQHFLPDFPLYEDLGVLEPEDECPKIPSTKSPTTSAITESMSPDPDSKDSRISSNKLEPPSSNLENNTCTALSNISLNERPPESEDEEKVPINALMMVSKSPPEEDELPEDDDGDGDDDELPKSDERALLAILKILRMKPPPDEESDELEPLKRDFKAFPAKVKIRSKMLPPDPPLEDEESELPEPEKKSLNNDFTPFFAASKILSIIPSKEPDKSDRALFQRLPIACSAIVRILLSNPPPEPEPPEPDWPWKSIRIDPSTTLSKSSNKFPEPGPEEPELAPVPDEDPLSLKSESIECFAKSTISSKILPLPEEPLDRLVELLVKLSSKFLKKSPLEDEPEDRSEELDEPNKLSMISRRDSFGVEDVSVRDSEGVVLFEPSPSVNDPKRSSRREPLEPEADSDGFGVFEPSPSPSDPKISSRRDPLEPVADSEGFGVFELSPSPREPKRSSRREPLEPVADSEGVVVFELSPSPSDPKRSSIREPPELVGVALVAEVGLPFNKVLRSRPEKRLLDLLSWEPGSDFVGFVA